MCGRFTIRRPLDDILAAVAPVAFPSVPEALVHPRYNVAPSQPVPIVRLDKGGGPECVAALWGLLPHWSRDAKNAPRPINARDEGVAAKPTFRDPFKRRRCVLPADGFYEWQKSGHGKQPFYIRRPGDAPFAFAGLWDRWDRGDDPVESCCLITTSPNAALQPVHDRMPVMLDAAGVAAWLNPSASANDLLALLRPFAGPLDVYPVSTRVNAPAHDAPDNVEPA